MINNYSKSNSQKYYDSDEFKEKIYKLNHLFDEKDLANFIIINNNNNIYFDQRNQQIILQNFCTKFCIRESINYK